MDGIRDTNDAPSSSRLKREHNELVEDEDESDEDELVEDEDESNEDELVEDEDESNEEQLRTQIKNDGTYISAPSVPAVHHHHITTNVNRASPAPARPVYIPFPAAPKRQANTIPSPAPKRAKLTVSRTFTSKGTTSKPRKSATTTTQRKPKAQPPKKLARATKKTAAPKVKASIPSTSKGTNSKPKKDLPLGSRLRRRSNESDEEEDESEEEEEDSDEGYLDHLGGELSIPAYNVKLSIPPGALEDSENIRIEVFTDLPNGIDLQDNEIAASFGFRCFPSGLSFKKPLTLSMPHCVDIDDNEVLGMVLHVGSNDKGEIMRIPLESNKYMIHSDRIELQLDHFSWGFLTFVFNFMSNLLSPGGNYESQATKRMLCTPFICKTIPNDRDRSIMHVRVYNKLPGFREEILAEEKSMNYKQIYPEGELFVKRDSIDMSISCKSEELTSTQTEDITAKKMMQCTKCTMNMELHSRRSLVTLILKQEDSLKMKFWADIEEPVTVHQRGRDQTINASGKSTVEGNAITSVTINTGNHPAEASTSQSQGRKRKAAASSGSKKRAKMGRKR